MIYVDGYILVPAVIETGLIDDLNFEALTLTGFKVKRQSSAGVQPTSPDRDHTSFTTRHKHFDQQIKKIAASK